MDVRPFAPIAREASSTTLRASCAAAWPARTARKATVIAIVLNTGAPAGEISRNCATLTRRISGAFAAERGSRLPCLPHTYDLRTREGGLRHAPAGPLRRASRTAAGSAGQNGLNR